MRKKRLKKILVKVVMLLFLCVPVEVLLSERIRYVQQEKKEEINSIYAEWILQSVYTECIPIIGKSMEKESVYVEKILRDYMLIDPILGVLEYLDLDTDVGKSDILKSMIWQKENPRLNLLPWEKADVQAFIQQNLLEENFVSTIARQGNDGVWESENVSKAGEDYKIGSNIWKNRESKGGITGEENYENGKRGAQKDLGSRGSMGTEENKEGEGSIETEKNSESGGNAGTEKNSESGGNAGIEKNSESGGNAGIEKNSESGGNVGTGKNLENGSSTGMHLESGTENEDDLKNKDESGKKANKEADVAEEDQDWADYGNTIMQEGKIIGKVTNGVWMTDTGENSLFTQKKVQTLNKEEYRDYEKLLETFYIVDPTTSAKETYFDIEKLLGTDWRIKQENELPQILIYHTHSQEAFEDSVPGDSTTTIVGAGSYLTELLEKTYGFHVIHEMGEYDIDSRSRAYTNVLPVIENYLKEYPSIQVIIDLHRDEVASGKLVTTVNGKPTARFMFFNGMSYLNEVGDISYLYNPYLEQNLSFSFQLQYQANEYYPGLARKIYLKGYRYNLHLLPRSVLIELGAQSNTREEIWNACEPLAQIIAGVLLGRDM